MGKVVVMGSYIYDISATMPHVPVPGETVRGYSCKTGPGGKGSNQAVAAHQAGAEVTMITKMGTDDFAAAMKKLLWRGARLVGGCCGTSPEYIRALSAAIR